MNTLQWGWHGKDICLDLCMRNSKIGTIFVEHSHEFYETFWIEDGYCQHNLNGKETTLCRGDIVFLSPGDSHKLEAIKEDTLIHINLSLEKNAVKKLKSRYEINELSWPWSRVNREKHYTLTLNQMRILKYMKENIDCYSLLDHDLFVLQLLHFLKEPHRNIIDGLPDWLKQSLQYLHERRLYGQGAKKLADISGFSREHIGRIIKKQLNKSTTELLNDFRLEAVVNLLRHTDRSIIEICEEFDFQSIAYFYKCFKKRYGQTPHRYRGNYRSRDTENIYSL